MVNKHYSAASWGVRMRSFYQVLVLFQLISLLGAGVGAFSHQVFRHLIRHPTVCDAVQERKRRPRHEANRQSVSYVPKTQKDRPACRRGRPRAYTSSRTQNRASLSTSRLVCTHSQVLHVRLMHAGCCRAHLHPILRSAVVPAGLIVPRVRHVLLLHLREARLHLLRNLLPDLIELRHLLLLGRRRPRLA